MYFISKSNRYLVKLNFIIQQSSPNKNTQKYACFAIKTPSLPQFIVPISQFLCTWVSLIRPVCSQDSFFGFLECVDCTTSLVIDCDFTMKLTFRHRHSTCTYKLYLELGVKSQWISPILHKLSPLNCLPWIISLELSPLIVVGPWLYLLLHFLRSQTRSV